MKKRPLRYGMVGGGVGSFIGGVHRKAIAIDEMAELTAGCFSDHDTRKLTGAAVRRRCGIYYRRKHNGKEHDDLR